MYITVKTTLRCSTSTRLTNAASGKVQSVLTDGSEFMPLWPWAIPACPCTLLPFLCRRSVQALRYYRLDRSAAQTDHTDHDSYQTRHIHSAPVTSLYAVCLCFAGVQQTSDKHPEGFLLC